MFDVKTVSMKIHDARIEKNMTQSNLADELGVSFQAVSNWERGNSLPDISKYEDLCRVLEVNLEYLLGIGSDSDTVSKLIERKKSEVDIPITVREIEAIAPILPPQELKEVVEANTNEGEIGMEDLIGLAPFLDRETLDELFGKAVPCDISELAAVAPFASKDGLAKLAERLLGNMADDEEIPFESLVGLAPFLDGQTLGRLLEYAKTDDFAALVSIAPFAPKDKLDELAARIIPSDITEVIAVAPFLSRNGVEELVGQLENKKEISANSAIGLAPFVGRQALEEMLEQVYVDDSAAITGLAPFVSGEMLKKLIQKAVK